MTHITEVDCAFCLANFLAFFEHLFNRMRKD
jgi:hypothetical protein